MKGNTFSQAWLRLRQNKAALFSSVVLTVIILLAAFSSWITPFDFATQDLMNTFNSPSSKHWLGTDELGRDVFSRLLYGARISMAVAILSTLTIVFIGTLWGAIAGFFGGMVDDLLMRFVDILYALPYMFFIIIITVIFGHDIFNLFIAIGALSWLTMARIVRGQVLSVKNKDFIMAAKMLGSSNRKIIGTHIIPNIMGAITVYAAVTVPRMILVEAFLSFLGLGIQEPIPSWGSLCNDGAKALFTAPWLILWPGLMMAITLICFNFLGDGLRDALDPELSTEGP
jgi:oligopeptide transport system permease protein